MPSRSPYHQKDEQTLMTEIWDPAIADDPEAFVLFVYPWGKENTPLAQHKGPRTWQRDKLQAIKEHIATNRKAQLLSSPMSVLQDATVSGRGPGKSSLTAWLAHWHMSTRLGSSTIVTANTEQQLKSRSWAEVGKWHTMAINEHWFDRSALSMRPQEWFDRALKTQMKVDTAYYYAMAQLWSEENPDAFAGVHNHNGIMVVFDEASGIPKPIWTVTEGFFTEPIVDRYWFVFSNGRRNTGQFFECFHRNRDFWRRTHIDSRKVEGVDSAVLDKIIRQYGEDSDEARIEVLGKFPRQGDQQFISRDKIDLAVARQFEDDPWAPLIMGVDIARFGDDKTVIRWRQGRNARVLPPTKIKGADNMAVANKIAHLIDTYDPDAVAIDAGNGTGVIDRLREMGYRVTEVWFGSKSDEPEWANKRTEIWAAMREWLNGGCIDDDQDLQDDLAGPEYRFARGSDSQILEAKEEMKKRGLASPDDGDALAVTFAVKPARKDRIAARGNPKRHRIARDVDYSVFG